MLPPFDSPEEEDDLAEIMAMLYPSDKNRVFELQRYIWSTRLKYIVRVIRSTYPN